MDGFIRFGSSVFGGVHLDGTPAEQWIGNTATARYAPLIVPPLRYPRDLPQLNAEWVRRMLSDSAVQLALAARKAPLLSVEFAYREQGRWMPGVRASDPAIGQFVHRQLQRLWKRGIARLLDSAQIWGWGAGEITFRRTRDAQIEVDEILVRDKDDVRPVVQDGTLIGVEFRRLQKSGISDRHPDKLALAFPRAIWHAHHPQSGQWFGWTVLAAAFSPWWDKHGSGGALDVRRLFMTKDGYRGTRIYYPSGTSTVQQPDGSIKQIPNQEIAMQIVETIRTGGVFALPSEVDANGTPRWKVEESQVSNNPSHILQYPKELDAEILNAMGIADDVLKSEATGSWAGKAVPQQATYCILEQWLSDLICDVDRVIEKLVEINFGPGHQYEITTRPLADQMLAQQNSAPSPAADTNAPPKGNPSHAPSAGTPQPSSRMRMGLNDDLSWLRMAWDPNQPRAPKDGVWIKSKFYEGGQFIPLGDFNNASPEERRIFDEKWRVQDSEPGQGEAQPIPTDHGQVFIDKAGKVYFAGEQIKDQAFERRGRWWAAGGGNYTLEDVLAAYVEAYGNSDELLLAYLRTGAHLALGDVWSDDHATFASENLETDFDGTNINRWIVTIEEDMSSAMEAAAMLRAILEKNVGSHGSDALMVVTPGPNETYEDALLRVMQASQKRRLEQLLKELETIKAAAEIGVSVVNDGADLAITMNELGEGNYVALIGLLPLVPSGIFKSTYLKISEFATKQAGRLELPRYLNFVKLLGANNEQAAQNLLKKWVEGGRNAEDLVKYVENPNVSKNLSQLDDYVLKCLKQCFAAGTPIRTPTGPIPIEAIKAGDLVWSRSENDSNGRVTLKSVEETFSGMSRLAIVRVGGQEIRTTRLHRFFVAERGWVETEHLRQGDNLIVQAGTPQVVDAIEFTSDVIPVYNFRVADDHTYFIGDDDWGFALWTHNTYTIRTLANGLVEQVDENGAVVARFKDLDDWKRHAVAQNITDWKPADSLTSRIRGPKAHEKVDLTQLDENVFWRTTKRDKKGRQFGHAANPGPPTLKDLNPRIREVPAADLESVVIRKHGSNPPQSQSVADLSNDELLQFNYDEPMGGFLEGDKVRLLDGHHRAEEIARRVADGRLPPDTKVRILVHD